MITTPVDDPLVLGGKTLSSRLFIGTGKYGADALIPAVAEASGSQVITVALRRVDFSNPHGNIMSHIPAHMQLLPNTSGARTAEEAVRIARLARAAGCGDWIKIEVISDARHLLPDGHVFLDCDKSFGSFVKDFAKNGRKCQRGIMQSRFLC